MAARSDVRPWVIVAGGFHHHGGMDRANAALASHLLRRGTPVHLVAHEIDPALTQHRLATPHLVSRPRGMPAAAERLLSGAGMRIARTVLSTAPNARIVVNGGNCPWPDVNWVHAVHAAWPVRDDGAPSWTRYRNRRLKQIARRRERDAVRQAAIVVANSESTRRALRDELGIAAARVSTVYLGSDPSWGPADDRERRAARTALALLPGAPTVAFVGALGTDLNKGFDVLWEAWKALRASAEWDAQLVVAGSGWRLPRWRRDAERNGGKAPVRFLGSTSHIREMLGAADLLVSPVRYEAYGLNVHEALCRGVPVMVTRTAGVVERFDAAMAESLLPEHLSASALASRLSAWRGDIDGWRARASATASRIRSRSWEDMAEEFVQVVEQAPRRMSA